MTDPDRETLGLIEAGRYRRLSKANERALVILAMGFPYWIFRDGRDYVLYVAAAHGGAVAGELVKFEEENRTGATRLFQYAKNSSSLSLFACAWLMSVFFLIQQNAPAWWVESGAAASEAIWRDGEWWRAITALTLHGDFSHFIANLAVGLLFAAFVLRLLGPGLTWLGILSSGALGNLLNAWIYRSETHVSIGASTAVFGGLGILVSCNVIERLVAGRPLRLWELILPIGAGLGLLAYLGVGDERTDVLAHFCGFAVGVVLGASASAARLHRRLSRNLQRVLAIVVLMIIFGAWFIAVAAHK